jgi:hypothetical protein
MDELRPNEYSREDELMLNEKGRRVLQWAIEALKL